MQRSKIRKGIAALALAVAVTGAVVPMASASESTARRGGCVTHQEFRRVRNGMTIRRVKQIYDTGGRLSLQSGSYTIRDYRTCRAYHVTNVSYQGGRVTGKLYV